MRDFKGMKRQRGRNRNAGGGGGKPQHNANRAFDSNGPEGVKVRGAAQHVYEKYMQLARDAATSGDRVLTENYQQHAEHYFRVMRAMQPQRPVAEIIGRDQFVSGFDIDFEDEAQNESAPEAEAGEEGGEGEAGADRERPQRFESRRDDRRDDRREERGGGEQPRYERWNEGERGENGERSDRGRGDRDFNRGDRDFNRGDREDRPRFPREDRPRREDRFAREDRQRDDRPPREDRPRDDRPRDDRQRDDRPRDDRPRDDRPREDRPRGDRPPRPDRDRDPLSVVEPEATPLLVQPLEAPAPVLRADDGEVSHAPAFLQARTPDIEAEPVRKPRRRRVQPSESEAPPPSSEG